MRGDFITYELYRSFGNADTHLVQPDMDSVKTNIARVEGLPNIVQLSPYKKVPDYYKVLGVDHSASDETIKKTYKALVLKIHPDKVGTSHRTLLVPTAKWID